MDSGQDITRIVRSWLSTDEHESADRVLGIVLAQLGTTQQRRSWWPVRRIADMNSVAKFAIGAAAVALVAVAGLAVLRPTVGPGPGRVASPSLATTPSPGPTSASSPSARADVFPSAGPIPPGRQRFSEDEIVFSFAVPDGWSSSGFECAGCAGPGGWLTRGVEGTPTGAWLLIWSVDGVSSDPCGVGAAPVAASAVELADAVAALPGTDVVTAPEDVTVGGRPAKHVVITVPDDIDCAPRQFDMWYVGNADFHVFRWATALKQTNRVWILDVDGKHFWFEVETYDGASPELEQEIQEIVDSIQFE
jgi:hypothetical protein